MNKDELVDFISQTGNLDKEAAVEVLEKTIEAINPKLPLSEEIKFSGKIFEIVEKTDRHNINGEIKLNHFEYARRSPGVRGIIINDDKILLTKEYRYELHDWDYRLPGGKVYDRLEDYRKASKDNTILEDVNKAICRELLEEVGITVENPYLYYISKSGSTIIWDLYYFIIDGFEFNESGQQLEEGEYISYHWFTRNEVLDLIKKDLMKEDRSIGILAKYILQGER